MRITSWNYLHGQAIPPGQNPSESETSLDSPGPEAVAAALASELIALQEIDLGQERSASKNQIADIAAAMGAQAWGFAPTVKGTPGFNWRKLTSSERQVITDLNQGAPELSSELSSELYGVAIASKIPVQHWLRYELGKAWIGLPLLIANEGGKVAPFYVKDEPRVALAAVLDNGWTVINTHLSFVPFVNIYQLLKVTRWAKRIEREHQSKVILLGDFNLPWGLPVRLTRWVRATEALSYPSWKPSISFDYILMREGTAQNAKEIAHGVISISDHRPISIEIEKP